jgi:nucleotide-binding universal stress UspA family protein
MNAIVACYDGSEQGERALARAAELALALPAKLAVVSVGRPARRAATELAVEPADAALVTTGVGPLPGAEVLTPPVPPDDVPDEGTLLLERARSFLVSRRVEADYIAEIGDPVERLLEVAEARAADLIVVGSRERGILERLLGRDVGEQVARRTGRDVLLVH